MYFDDPVFTFQDSMIYGCTVSLNYLELQDFCLNRGWNNLLIFQNLYQDAWFGVSGNSNPHFSQDWKQITTSPNDEIGGSGSWTNQGVCSFPSTHKIQVFYQKINTK